MEAQKTRYKEELKKAEELLVQADKEGFKEFYEKMNEKLAQSLYEEILKEEKANEKAKEFAQIYEKWTPRLLQNIEELGDSQLDLVVETLRNMKKDVAAEIISEMIVGNHPDAVRISQYSCQFFYKGGLARSYRTSHADFHIIHKLHLP